MDDANWAAIPEPITRSALERILEQVGKPRAALFVIGKNVENEEGRRILAAWSTAGHLVGNHTYDHVPLFRSNPETFCRSIESNESVIESYPTFRKWFRFPALKEGDTRETRDAVRAFLGERGYRNGHVTIDASDWYYDQRLRKKLQEDPGFPVERFREPYVAHILDRALFYDRLSVDVLGRSVPHTLLVHYNLLNALFLGDVLRALESEGFTRVDVEDTYSDPVYRERVDVLPAGESLIWALAHASGNFESRLRYPGEDGEYEKSRLDALDL